MIDTAGPKAPAASSRPPLLDRRSLTKAHGHRGAAAARHLRAAAAHVGLLHRHDDPGGHLLHRHARPRAARRPGRPVLPRPARGAHDRRLGRRPAAVRHQPAVHPRADRGGPGHGDHRLADHAARAPAARPVPRADHADAGRRRHRGRGDAQLPEWRRRLLRVQRGAAPYPADQAAVVRGHRSGVLPVLGDRRDRHVPARLRAPADPAGPGLGGDQAERARRPGGRH